MKQGKLPEINIEPTQQDKIIDALSMVLLAFLFLLPLLFYSQLPERMPSHFNAAGEPDAYSSKSSIWIMPVVGLITYFIFTFVHKMDPSNFSYPTRITPENAESKYRNTLQLLRWTKLVIMVLFVYLVWMSIRIGLGSAAGLHTWFIWAFLAAMLIPIIYFGFIKK
ncbi:MAG: DUF1648 domain-containing protein [Bacteroidota bacterium]